LIRAAETTHQKENNFSLKISKKIANYHHLLLLFPKYKIIIKKIRCKSKQQDQKFLKKANF